jgi:diguanylate cyclase (GGDEF)-like protein
MKVSGPRGAAPPRQINKSAALAPAAGASPVASVDAVSIAGVPEGELTPRVRAALVALMEEVADLRRELAETRRRMVDLETLASADPLLGILNRRAFVGELNRALAMSQRYGQPSSLIFIDLDDLKKINDGLGHAAGDAALAHVAAVASANIRQTDVFGRLGGDEFAIILTNTGKAQAELKARSLADIVRSAPCPIGRPVSVTCGVVEISGEATAEAALIAADRVMYEEKRRK